jgi:hypothetical protein
MSVTGELAGTVSLVVFAFNAGGATLAAAYAASRTLAGVGVMLVLTGLTRWLRRDLLLRQITGLRAVLLAAAAGRRPARGCRPDGALNAAFFSQWWQETTRRIQPIATRRNRDTVDNERQEPPFGRQA